MTVQIAGRYYFVSQENFEDYLKAEDFGMIKRNVLTSSKPDIQEQAKWANTLLILIASILKY